jgi:hypothetical protein
MTNGPQSHRIESVKTVKNETVNLYTLKLKGTPSVILHFTDGPSVTWQGNLYQIMQMRFSEPTRNSDGEYSRSSLTLNLPEGSFNSLIDTKRLSLATLTVDQVLGQHITLNANITHKQVWLISKPRAFIPGIILDLEVTSIIDQPDYMSPAEFFLPPKFPWVVL